MKRVAKLIAVVLLLISAPAVFAGASAEVPAGREITPDSFDEIATVLDYAGLENADTFREWVSAFAAGGMSGEQGDADCRMTVMLLAGDKLSSSAVNRDYEGTYLMFDLDAIENDPSFAILRDKEALFQTVFGETGIPEGGLKEALANVWNEYGISFANDRCSIISVVFKAYGEDKAFVGHTGLLIDCGGYLSGARYMFVEKLAFYDPFMITELESVDELIALLSSRPDYSGEEGDPSPAVYMNDEFIGELGS